MRLKIPTVKKALPYELHLGDCLEVMKSIPEGSIDTIVTSPPYNKKGLSGNRRVGNNIWKKFNIDYSSYDDSMDEDSYRQWQIDFINECHRVLKPNGSLFYNHKVRRFNNKGHFPDWVFHTKLNFYQMIIWDRLNCCDMRNDYCYPNTELIFWLTKGKPVVYKSQALFNKEVWGIPPTNSKTHPASFPEQLSDNCILLSTQEGDTVLDPFMGSGTTGLSCTRLNRKFIGIELGEEYYNVAKERIEQCQKDLAKTK